MFTLTRSTRLAMTMALFAGLLVPLGLTSQANAATGVFLAGAAEAPLDIPVGVPLGGYLRPPVGGDLLPALEALSGGDPSLLPPELLDFIPVDQDDPTQPQAPVPDEARGPASPWTTFMPPSRGYYETLLSKAIAISDGEDTMVIVKAAIIGSLDELRIEVARRVNVAIGIDLSDTLIITATHTHDGPGALATNSTRYFFLALDAFQAEIYDRVAQQTADLVIDAIAAMVPAQMGYATGQESHENSLNSFRRSRSPWDEARVAQQEVLRRRMGVVRFDEVDASGAVVRPIATIINYSAHGIMFGVENLYYSGDALGSAEREFEDTFDTPVVAMFVQAAVGDVSPRADGRPTLQRIERFGRLLAPQLRGLYDSVNNFDAAPDVEVRSKRFRLNLDVLGYDDTEYPYPYGAVQCNGGINQEECLPAPPPDATDLLDNGDAENATFVPMDSIVTGARIGDLLLIGQPGEALTEQGLRLLEASPFAPEDTFILGLAQDHVGYILPDSKDDWLLGGTEGTTTFWGWKQGGRILDVSVEVMNALAGTGPDPVNELTVSYTTMPFVPVPATLTVSPGAVVRNTSAIDRLSATSFEFQGGDPVLGTPVVTVEEFVDGAWAPVTERGGRPMNRLATAHLKYTLVSGQHQWLVDFEAPYDWPAGRYRIAADGRAQGVPAVAPFRTVSAPFDVAPTDTLLLGPVTRDGNTVSATFSYPTIEENYRIIDPLVRAEFNAPVRAGCVRFTDGDTVVIATTPTFSVVDGIPVATYSVSLPGTGTPSVNGVDQFGNFATSPACLPVIPEEPTPDPTTSSEPTPAPTTSASPSPSPTPTPTTSASPPPAGGVEPGLARVAGADRFETAAANADAAFPDGADTVFVATGRNFPDALAAGPVAARENAPIVLVEQGSVPTATADVLRRLGPTKIVVVGGPEAVGSDVLAALRTIADVTVVAGESRYETAVLIAQRGFPDGADAVYIATGRNFPDALSGAALAGRDDAPVVLVDRDAIPDVVTAELARLSPRRIVVLGAAGAVSDVVVVRLDGFADAAVTRLQGTNRYATSAAIAGAFPARVEVVYLVTGANFPDALSATPAAIRAGAPVLLTTPDVLAPEARTALERLAPRRIVVLGGLDAVSRAVADEAAGLLRSDP